MTENEEYCEQCFGQGLFSKLIVCDINFDDSIKICENEQCTSMLQTSSSSISFQEAASNIVTENHIPENGNAVDQDLSELFNQLSNLDSNDNLLQNCDVDFDAFFSDEPLPVNHKQEYIPVKKNDCVIQCETPQPESSLSCSSKSSSVTVSSRSRRSYHKVRTKMKKTVKPAMDSNSFHELLSNIDYRSDSQHNKSSNISVDLTFNVKNASDIFSTTSTECSGDTPSSSSQKIYAPVESYQKKAPQKCNIECSVSDIVSISGSRANSSSGISLGSNDSELGLTSPTETLQNNQIYVRSKYMDIIKNAMEREWQLKRKKPKVYDGLDLNSIKKTQVKNRKKYVKKKS